MSSSSEKKTWKKNAIVKILSHCNHTRGLLSLSPMIITVFNTPTVAYIFWCFFLVSSPVVVIPTPAAPFSPKP